MKKRIIISLVAIIVVVLTIAVLYWVLTKEDKMTDDKINQLRIGMREEDVLNLLGEPDRKWGLEPTRSAVDVHYQYELENTDELELNFSPDLVDQDRNNQILSSVVVRLSDGNPITLLDGSDPIGTSISVNLDKRRYSFIEPTFNVASDSSEIAVNQINQIERGMSLNSAIKLLGDPKKINDADRYQYAINNEAMISLRFESGILHGVSLVSTTNEHISQLLSSEDPWGTRIHYIDRNGSFSKTYPSFSFNDFDGDTFAESIILIKSGMSKEEVIGVMGIPDKGGMEEGSNLSYQIQDGTSVCFVFHKSLYVVYILQNNPQNDYSVIYLLSDRDPIGTQIQYDPETGYFSKIVPE